MATVSRVNPYAGKVVALARKLALDEKQFEHVSQMADHELVNNPRLYKQKVAALAVVGYGFIWIIIGLLVWALIGSWNLINHHGFHFYNWKLIAVLGVLLFAMLKSLWITVAAPEGIEIKRETAPALFAMIDELSASLGTKVDVVLIDGYFNASVVQMPRFGLAGVYRNYMILGLPLMMTHTAEEFKGILAHELGHLSGNHSKSAAWIYNLRMRWSKLLSNAQADAFFILFYLFFSWFSPRFDAYSLALARRHELEADAQAVRLVGAHAFSSGMMRMNSLSSFVSGQFWEKQFELAKNQEQPPENVFATMKDEIAALTLDKLEVKRSLQEAFASERVSTSTHPSIKQRLLMGHFEPVVQLNSDNELSDEIIAELIKPVDTECSAAEVYLGSALPLVLKEQSSDWRRQVSPSWLSAHNQYDGLRQRLKELSGEESLPVERLKEKASLTLRLEGEAASLPFYRQLWEIDSEDVVSQYNVGVIMLNEGDENGLSIVREAIGKRPSQAGDGYGVMIKFLKKRGAAGDNEQVAELENLLASWTVKADEAAKEREGIDNKSIFEQSQLTNPEIDYLREIFRHIKAIDYVLVVRKKVEHFPDMPFLVFGVEMNTSPFNSEGANEKLQMARWMLQSLDIRQDFCVTTFDLGSKSIRERMQAVPGAYVYFAQNDRSPDAR